MKHLVLKAENLIELVKLTKGEIAILSELLKRISFDGEYSGYIILNSSIRREIVEKLNIGSASFNNSLNSLNKKGFIVRKDTNMYLVNNELFNINESL